MAWTLVNSWTYSSPVANVDFTGLNYSDVRVLVRGVTVSASGQRALRVSTNNGSSYLTTSGDYVAVAAAGTETNDVSMTLHATGSTAARSAEIEICGFNLTSPKLAQLLTRTDFRTVIIPTASALNAIRVLDSGGGNLTAGNIYVYAR